ncbi:MAG: hypothetical protein OXF54_03790 [Caldilineaceae bacterium]|nr:hypothetical protein [Caldilineaceae bacterium]
MREALAARLLAKVMDWAPEDVAKERPILQDLASYKYDGYQQFSAGMHFIESLSIWLSNLNVVEERRAAYRFVRERLIYISEAEMRHLVGLSYPDYIRDVLLQRVAKELDIPDYLVANLLASDAFKKAERKSLFLGLSDGARIDVFRRMAGLSNEQVYGTYQLSEEKSKDMVQELRKALSVFSIDSSEERFNTVFLLDDFAGSGDSLLRKEDGKAKGKIVKCLNTLRLENNSTQLLDLPALSVYVVLYMATRQAFEALTQRIEEQWAANLPRCTIVPLYIVEDDVRVTRDRDPQFDRILESYYDNSLMDRHLEKGGEDVVHGYANCSLPLVLAHNTPNNSVYLLWADKHCLKTKALFPRVSRHREEL